MVTIYKTIDGFGLNNVHGIMVQTLRHESKNYNTTCKGIKRSVYS